MSCPPSLKNATFEFQSPLSPPRTNNKPLTPTVPKETTTDDNETTTTTTKPSALAQIHQNLSTLGLSLRCPLCLSTLSNPCLLPCIHAFCRNCITTSLYQKPACPVCKIPATRRSLRPSSHLAEIVVAYKRSLRAFGLRPIVYDPKVDMTQLECGEGDEGDDDVGSGAELGECYEGVLVSKAWVGQLKGRERVEQEKVVECNERALIKAAVRRSRSMEAKKNDDSLIDVREKKIRDCMGDDIEDDSMIEEKDDTNKKAAASRTDESTKKHGKKTKTDLAILKSNETMDRLRTKAISSISSKEKLHGNNICDDNVPTFDSEILQGTIQDDDGDRDDGENERSTKTQSVSANMSRENETFVQDVSTTEQEGSNTAVNPISVGSVVQVQPRTWPGVNKQGGIGRVTYVHNHNATLISYDIAYVLGGREMNVDASFVSLTEEVKNEETRCQANKRKKQNTTTTPERKRKSSSKGRWGSSIKKKKRTTLPAETPPSTPPPSPPDETTPTPPPPTNNPTQTFSLADAHYAQTLTLPSDNPILYVVTSSVNSYALELLHTLTLEKKKKGIIIKTPKDISPLKSPTILVTPSQPKDPTTCQFRTLKTMRAAIRRIPMVTPDWIAGNLGQDKLVIPKEYIRSLPMKREREESKGAVARYAACCCSLTPPQEQQQQQQQLQRQQQESNNGILGGWNVYFVGNWKKAKKSDSIALLKDLAAKVLTTPHAAAKCLKKSRVLFLDDDGCSSSGGGGSSSSSSHRSMPAFLKDEIKKYMDNVVIVGGDWLFDVVSCGVLLDKRDYEPKGEDKDLRFFWERGGNVL